MARIEIPDGEGLEPMRAHTLLPPDFLAAMAAFEKAVARSTLDRRLHELVRMRVAKINQCMICMSWRNTKWCDDEALLQGVEHPDALPGYTDAERVALEYTTRFCTDSTNIDQDLFDRLAVHLSPGEILQLTLVIGKYLAFGRYNQVLGLDTSCSVDEIRAAMAAH